MRSFLLSLSSFALASSTRLQLPPFLTNAHAVLYGYTATTGFFPEANLTLSYDLATACLHFTSLTTYRPDLTTELSQCSGLQTSVSSNTLSCLTKPQTLNFLTETVKYSQKFVRSEEAWVDEVLPGIDDKEYTRWVNQEDNTAAYVRTSDQILVYFLELEED